MLVFEMQSNLRRFMPSILELIGDQDIAWSSINTQYSERHALLIEESDAMIPINGGSIRINASIYEVIFSATTLGNRQAFGLFNFCNEMFTDLASKLTDEEKKSIRPNIYSVLTNLDCNYLNFVGEMALLNSLLTNGEYKLLGVEYEFPNEKRIDFKLLKVSNQTIVLVEVLNIQVNSERVERNNSAITRFLTKRVTDKVKDKTEGLTSPEKFIIVPVIWGTAEALKIYSDFFKENKLELENVNEPTAYITFTDYDFYFHRFGKISTLFNQPDEATISKLKIRPPKMN